jgi:rhodanese-related sulfurtransferase
MPCGASRSVKEKIKYWRPLHKHFISENIIIAEFCKDKPAMGFLSFLGLGDNITNAIRHGAIIIDVRPAYAFDQHGRVPGSVNIPLDRIAINIERIKTMKKPIVICCAYGTDCANAVRMLKASGIKQVYNGGNWESVFKKVRRY